MTTCTAESKQIDYNELVKHTESIKPDTVNIPAIKEYIHKVCEALLSGSTEGNLCISSFGQDPVTGTKISPRIEFFKPSQEKEIISFIESVCKDKHRNISIPLVLYRDGVQEGRGKKEDILSVFGLVADFDDENAENYLERLPLQPSIVTETSKGRYQAQYRFCQPVSPSEASEMAEALTAHTGCDPITSDINHPWRIPGSLNWPNEKKCQQEGRSPEPQLSRVIQAFSGFTDPQELKESLRDTITRLSQEKEKKALSVNENTNNTDNLLIWDGQDIETLPIAKETKDLILNGVPEGQRSEAMMTVMNGLAYANCTDEQIFQIFEQYSIGEKYREKGSDPEWLKPQIDKARHNMKGRQRAVNRNGCVLKNSEDNSQIINNSKPIKILKINDFMELDIPPRENILNPWLPKNGICMIYAPRGVGKTHFSLGIADAVTRGSRFLLWEAEQPRSVLFIDGEMSQKDIQDRLNQIFTSCPESIKADFNIYTPEQQEKGTIDLSTLEDQEALEPFLEGIDLIIADNISTLCRTGKENEREAWIPVQDWALKQRKLGRSVLFIHHAGKSGGQRGTSGREDVMDTVISLKNPEDYKKSEGVRVIVTYEKARGFYGDDALSFEASLTTNEDGTQAWTWKTIDGSFEPYIDEEVQQVAYYINTGYKQIEIAGMLGVHKSTISKKKKEAEKLGLINKISIDVDSIIRNSESRKLGNLGNSETLETMETFFTENDEHTDVDINTF